jgi:hypothetical protein
VKPGDLIEWVCRPNNIPVREYECLWSSMEDNWVPIGPELTHLCVFRDGKTITWLNEKGLFHASVDDIAPAPRLGAGHYTVHPRELRG